MIKHTPLRLIAVACAGAIALASGYSYAAEPRPDFDTWLEGVRAEALKRGIKRDVVTKALAGVQPIRRIIERDRSQPEFKLTLERYRKRVVTPRNIAVGRRMARRHRAVLDAVARKYNVQPRFILAIWGIETRYGAITADVPLIPALATLAYDARRSTYFRRQLFAALQMVNRGYIELGSLFGSWAGAMGQPQFMPSSYMAFAQDFDGDGKRDIWKNEGDVFASIANYLAKHGWRADQTWGRPVRVPKGIAAWLGEPTRRAAPGCRARTSGMKRLSEWQKLGIRRADGSDLPTRDIPAALVRPDGAKGEGYLVYGNYAGIMAYNCAHLYAITVGTLADRIKG